MDEVVGPRGAWEPLGSSEGTWSRPGTVLRALGGVLKAMLSHLGLSCTILEAILGSSGPSWSHLMPSWAIQRLAKRSLQAQGEGVYGGGGTPSPKGNKGGLA